MTFNLSDENKFVFYLNFKTSGQFGVDKLCESEQNFAFTHLIEDSSRYVMSIERFCIPIQSIPMVDAIANAIILRNNGAGPDQFISLLPSFSLYEWFRQINSAGIVVSLNGDGRIMISNFDFNAYSIELSVRVAEIFDMDQVINLVGIQTVQGATPCMDRFDQLYGITILAENGLSQLQQEIETSKIFRTTITDFLIPSDYSISCNWTPGAPPPASMNINLPVRQNLEFNASGNRRFCCFRGSSPIQNLKIRVIANMRDGTSRDIVLPNNSVFSLKLAFFNRGSKPQPKLSADEKKYLYL